MNKEFQIESGAMRGGEAAGTYCPGLKKYI